MGFHFRGLVGKWKNKMLKKLHQRWMSSSSTRNTGCSVRTRTVCQRDPSWWRTWPWSTSTWATPVSGSTSLARTQRTLSSTTTSSAEVSPSVVRLRPILTSWGNNIYHIDLLVSSTQSLVWAFYFKNCTCESNHFLCVSHIFPNFHDNFISYKYL